MDLSNLVREAELEIRRGRANNQAGLNAQAGAAGAVANRRPPVPKATDLLKPDVLQHDDKPSVLRLWKREYEDYYKSNEMEHYDTRVQQNFFMQCISTKLRTKVRHQLTSPDTTPVLAVPHEPLPLERTSQSRATRR